MRGTPAGSLLVLVSGFGARLLLGLAITALVGRVLSPSDFGFFALTGSLFFAARFLFDLGTGSVAVREIARRPERERPILEGLLGWRRLCGLVLGVVVFAWALAEPDPRRRQVLFGVAVALPLLAPGALAPIFTLRQAQGGPALVRTLGQLGVLVGAGLLQLAGAVGAAFAWLPVGRELWTAFGVGRRARRHLDYRPNAGVRGRELGPFLRMSLLQGSAMLFLTAIFHTDVFLVRGLRGEAELGAYAAAFRPIQPLLALPALVVLPLVPRLSQAAAEARRTFRGLVSSLFLAATGLGLVCALVGAAAAPLVLRLLYGDAYSGGALDATAAMRWLSVALGFAVLAGPLTTAVMAERGDRVLLGVHASGFVANVIGNLWLLPREGFVGAALMTACTQAGIATALVVTLIVRRSFGGPLGPAALGRELAAPAGERPPSVAGDGEG